MPSLRRDYFLLRIEALRQYLLGRGGLTILLFLIVCTTDALRSHSISGIAELNPVAGLSRGDDVTNRGRALLGFCDSTPRHDAHGPADDRRGVSLDLPRHLQPGDHRSPRSQECKQQSEFFRGPFDGLRCAACGARSGVNLRNEAVFAVQKLVPSLGKLLSVFNKDGSLILGFLLGPICQRKCDRPKLWSRAIEFKGHSERSISGASYSDDSAALSHAHSWIRE